MNFRTAILATACMIVAGVSSSSAQIISNVAATGITSGSAVITWTTDQATSSLVNYGVTANYGSSSSLNTMLTTVHSVTLSGLAANTLYNFDVVSANSASTSTTSANFRLATLGVSPVLSGINVTNVTTTSATVNWTTDQPANDMVNYGITSAYGSASQLGSKQVTAHSVTLTGLTPGTIYFFDVVSGNSTSASQTFVTADIGAPPPNVGAVTLTGINDSSASVAWTTDVAAGTVVAYGTSSALGQLTPIQSGLTTNHSVALSGLSRGTTYYLVAISSGTSATGYSPLYTFTTTGPVSLVPAISNVATSGLSSTSATITWTTDQPSTTQVNYGTGTSYGLSSTLDPTLTTSHSVTLTGLTPGTQYDFQLVSASTTGTATSGADMTGVTVWTWGDSLTQGGQDGTQNTYPRYLATDIGATVNNEGVDGITSTQIAQMMLGTPASFGAGNCHVIWSGGNNPNQVSTVLTDIASMVAALSSPSCFLILGDINDGWTAAGSPTYNSIVSTNQSLATLYPNNYINIRELLVQDYNPALPLDVASYRLDVTPISLQAVEPFGTITSGALDNASCNIGVSNGTFGSESVIIIDSETILINAVSADQMSVTDCTRGYNGTAAASHQANSIYSIVDAIHLGANGYAFVAQQVAAWFAAQRPLNFTTPTTATSNPVIGTPTVSSITSTSAVVNWTTDQATTSQVNYGVSTNYGSASTLNPAFTTAHSVTLTGLTPNTEYNFDVVSASATGASSASANLSFTTSAAAVVPPVISGVATANVTSSSATITWNTDQPATAQVSYGITTSYGTLAPATTALALSQAVTLTGLTPNTTYYYQVTAVNASGTTATSANYTFTTAAAAVTPTPVPTPAPGAPAPYVGYVAFWGITDTGITISWSTDVYANTVLAYGTTQALGQTYTPADSTLTASHGVVLTGLTPGTTYYFVAESTGANGATGYSTTYSFTTSGTMPASPGFSLSSSATTAAAGANGTSTVTVTPMNGFASAVTLTTSGWPTGITGTFGTSAGTSSILTIGVAAGVTPGTYLLSVNGTSGTVTEATTFLLTVTPAITSLGSSASFTGTDTSTQGTWGGTYGSDGAMIANGLNALPAYATLGLTGDLTFTWAAATSDVRALQNSSGSTSRTASTYYSTATAFNIALNLSDGATHQVAIYMLDWDATSQTQTVTITDSATGMVLDSRNFTAFSGGTYGVWNIKGSVNISVAAPFGSAVASGIFFDPASGTAVTPSFALSATTATALPGSAGTSNVTVVPAGGFNSAVTLAAANWPTGISGTFGTNPASGTSVVSISLAASVAPGTYSLLVTGTSGNLSVSTTIPLTVTTTTTTIATFDGFDKTTQGTWTGSYGADGYQIANGAMVIPSYASLGFVDTLNFTWAGLTTDIRALQSSAGASTRLASAYTQGPGQPVTINVGISDGNTHKISLYFLDWDTSSRVETVTVLDAVTNKLLDSETISGFHNGEFASWNINGNVIIQVTPAGYFSPAVSGIFFN